MSCISNFCKCSAFTGKPPYCCSGFCLQYPEEDVGYCTQRNWTPSATDSTICETDLIPDNSASWIIYMVIALVVAIVCLAGLVYLCYRTRKLEKILTKREQELFFSGDSESIHFNRYAHETTDSLPYNKQLEIAEADYEIDWKKPLGQGTFGIVLKGNLKKCKEVVAIKTVRGSDIATQHLRSLLSEIKVLQYIGKMEGVVSIVGCHTAKLSEGKVYLFLEFCPLGSLENHLRTHKYAFLQQHKQTEATAYSNVEAENAIKADAKICEISPLDLLTWSMQIANAMQFLADRKVIHADLATRNVLLLRKDCIKITDFGLSRRLYDYGNYVKQNQEPLPWRWMALESLQQLSFSHQSDVWSLGITLWEIYSLGDVPYPGLSWTTDFVVKLENNLRPTKPFAASDEIYDIMLDCWKVIPEFRPMFREVYRRLHET